MILAAHIDELRGALDEARGVIGMSPTPFPYTDNSITAEQTVVKGIHVREVRQAVSGVLPN